MHEHAARVDRFAGGLIFLLQPSQMLVTSCHSNYKDQYTLIEHSVLKVKIGIY